LHDGTSLRDLGTLGGDSSQAFGINDAEQVVGWSEVSAGVDQYPGRPHAFLCDRGTMHDLGTLGGSISWAYAINAAEQVIGWSRTAEEAVHGFLWQQGKMIDLGTLGGSWSEARGINSIGQVVGMATTPDSAPHAVLWHGSTTRDLGVLGGTGSDASAINMSGQIVGHAMYPVPDSEMLDYRAFLWQKGKMADLNDLIAPDSDWELTYAGAINDVGQIVGVGRHLGRVSGFLLTPLGTA
jgi:probable HAF family extracellular repeat protein